MVPTDYGEAGHDQGKCGNAACFERTPAAKDGAEYCRNALVDRLRVPSMTDTTATHIDRMRMAADEIERAWAARERCDVLTDDMLRYAMAAMGTGSPADADKFRMFWRFAVEARNTRT